MRVERFYHNAPSAAESNSESVRALTAPSAEFALPAHAFPQGLEAAVYALRKRLICPRWWLVGVMSQWLSKDSEQLVLQLGLRDGDWVVCGQTISAKCFPLVVVLWTEIFAQTSKTTGVDNFSLELDLSRLLRGTASELDFQREFLTGYLSSALRVQQVRAVLPRSQGRRSKSAANSLAQFTLEPVGLVQIVENVVLKHGTEDRLLVHFTKDPRRLFSDAVEDFLPTSLLTCIASERLAKKPLSPVEFDVSVVSLQPDVLQAFSRATSPKKLCSYLALELMKKSEASLTGAESESEVVWRGRALGLKELTKMHKEQLVKAQTFYDHGILSWENEAPKQRVRQLVNSSPQQADSGIVQCWRMSQHALDAVQFERALSGILRDQGSRSAEISSSTSTVMLEAASVVVSHVSAEACASEASDEVRNPRTSLPRDSMTPSSPAVSPISVSHAQIPSPGMGAQRRVPVLERSSLVVEQESPARHSPVRSMQEQDSFVRSSSVRHTAPATIRDATNPSRNTALSDDDFLMCVAEFYESLTPLQQQAFERERRKMSPEQFKTYVMPALLRLRGRG